jgi:hypothetical protein
MARKSFKEVWKSSWPYLLFAIANIAFFCVPLAWNSYVSEVKKEDIANKIADVAKGTGYDGSSFAVTMTCDEPSENEAANRFGIEVLTYNNQYASINALQLSGGLITDDKLSFSYNGLELDQIHYSLVSGIFSNHESTVGGTLYDYYQIWLYSKDPNTDYAGCSNFCYITDITADKMMAANPDLKTYDDVINQKLTVTCAGKEYTWKISNVFINRREVYKGLTGIYGDFICSYIHLPKENQVNKRMDTAVYFSSNAYLNIRTINKISNIEKAKFKIYRGNLGFANQDTLDEIESYLNTLPYYSSNVWWYCAEVISVSLLCNLFCAFYLFRLKDLKMVYCFASIAAALVVAYSIFWIIYKATSSIFYLSYYGVLGMLLVCLASMTTTFLVKFEPKKRKKEKKNEEAKS